MTRKSIRKNYIYNVSYEILLLLTPLITTPHLSRVLGPDGVGTISFVESIVSYFTLVATLGVTTFGKREISYVQDEIEKRSNIFWETKVLSIIISLMVLLIYISFAFSRRDRIMYLIFALNLLAVTADVTWFFQGMEEFGKIALRNVIFKLINITYIFIAVREKGDINRYAFGIAFFSFLSNISLWAYLPKFVKRPKTFEIKPFRNIKTVIILFIPSVAIQIYTVLDKTMIGMITRDAFENGYYEQALKLSRMVLTIITALGTVMIPRIGYHFRRKEDDKVKTFMYRSYCFVWFLGIPLCFGLVGIASNFVPWFYGAGYGKVETLLSVLSFLILAIGINNVTGMQYLIPTKRQNTFTLTVLIGATMNCLLNVLLIRKYQSVGAAIASVTAETTIALVQLWIVRKEFSIKIVITSCGNYLIAGCVMLVCLKLLGNVLSASVLHTFLMILTGATIYFLTLLIIKDKFFICNVKNIVSKAKTILAK